MSAGKVIARAGRAFERMNKLEASFAAGLEEKRRSGKILSWRYEAMTFRLGSDCRYTPDFCVLMPSYDFQFYEVKGFWRDDAKVKLKSVAASWPEFAFFSAERKAGAWIIKEVQP